ncbi:hypothetical protein GALL_278790 [mine drainage metagenome]|uniref:Uncharacterized protein n=1 Tax=mine drainage metagenome TaxID=410659 RepID=A0A1J5R2R3_9ZZZZ
MRTTMATARGLILALRSRKLTAGDAQGLPAWRVVPECARQARARVGSQADTVFMRGLGVAALS